MKPPALAYDWTAIRDIAIDLLDKRATSYPGLVTAEKMTAAKAESGLRIMRAIADDWRARADGRLHERASGATTAERAETTAQIVERHHSRSLRLLADLDPATRHLYPHVATDWLEDRARALDGVGQGGGDPIRRVLDAEAYLEPLRALAWWEARGRTAIFAPLAVNLAWAAECAAVAGARAAA